VNQFTMNRNPAMMAFEYSSHIEAPVEDVFAFHERADAIELLTGPGQGVQVISRSGGLEIGAQVEFRIRVGPVKLYWLAHHIAYEKNRLFIDEQREGPFAAWVHAHRFDAEDGGTRLTDSIEFALQGGGFIEKMAGWIIKRKLQKMFKYRHMVTRRMCESAAIHRRHRQDRSGDFQTL
jgi:ligand-binding SRPBCC domain-containing protein